MTFTDELVAWLTGVLDEDQQQAETVKADLARLSSYITYNLRETSEDGSTTTVRHLRLYEPDAVLADIAAKREIIADCAHFAPTTDHRGGFAEEVLRSLASAYAHRPGYRQEWAP